MSQNSSGSNAPVWVAFAAITVVGVGSLGSVLANISYTEGLEDGKAQEREEIIGMLTESNKACWDAAKTQSEARDCLLQFSPILEISSR